MTGKRKRSTWLSIERLREVLAYDPETGIFTWRLNQGRRRVGDLAGSTMTNGYIQVMIDGKNHLAHRLAWMYTYNRQPNGDTDHVNGVRDDNRIANLRECDRSQNMSNCKRHRDNQSGVKGVCWHDAAGKWKGSVMQKGVCRTAYFENQDGAEQWVRDQRGVLHLEFANHG